MSKQGKTTRMTSLGDNMFEWQFEFRGKRYGDAIGKGDTDGITNLQQMHSCIDLVAKRMHKTIDAIDKQDKKSDE